MNSKTIHLVITVLILITSLLLASQTVSADTMKASWYGPGFQGKRMANGDVFNMNDPTTVAHKTLPKGTKLLLINVKNNRQQVVYVRDRGPFKKGRDIDLSKAAAKELGLVFNEKGIAEIKVVRLNWKT